MSSTTPIEWTDSTWNPLHGCTEVSPGCANCYAKTFSERFRGVVGHHFQHGFDLRLIPHRLNDPLFLKRPRKIFVNSMSDLFHEKVPEDYIEKVCRTMLTANWHTYQVLTKRHVRMSSLLKTTLKEAAAAPHIWWGGSVENRRHGLPRIDALQQSGAAVKFLSVEPLLEDLGAINLSGIDWVIVGGESGPRARPMMADWVVGIRDQCQEARVPFFFKQWGGTRKKKAGRLLEGRAYDEFPDAHHLSTKTPDKAVTDRYGENESRLRHGETSKLEISAEIQI
jgi:protein gp37